MMVAELPKTRSGKIMRRLLRDVAEHREVGDVTTLADSLGDGPDLRGHRVRQGGVSRPGFRLGALALTLVRREVWSAAAVADPGRSPSWPQQSSAAPARLFSRGSLPRRLRGSRRSCAPRPPVACCCSRPPWPRWSGRTAPGRRRTTTSVTSWSARRRCTSTCPSATWAADGLLAIFFFVAGLELKREFVAGDLRDPRRAALPVVAAVGGMVVPAAGLRRRSTSATAAACARVGDPDGHRHRVRAGRSWR